MKMWSAAIVPENDDEDVVEVEEILDDADEDEE
jgi:hypothetical protein